MRCSTNWSYATTMPTVRLPTMNYCNMYLVLYPKTGEELGKGKKKLYLPFNLGDYHWVSICINLEEFNIIVFDCNIGAMTNDNINKAMLPLCSMIPIILRLSRQFEYIGNCLHNP